jgi:hypothetical protein
MREVFSICDGIADPEAYRSTLHGEKKLAQNDGLCPAVSHEIRNIMKSPRPTRSIKKL